MANFCLFTLINLGEGIQKPGGLSILRGPASTSADGLLGIFRLPHSPLQFLVTICMKYAGIKLHQTLLNQ